MAETTEVEIKKLAGDLAKSIEDLRNEVKSHGEASQGNMERFEQTEARFKAVEGALGDNTKALDELNAALGKMKSFNMEGREERKEGFVEKLKSAFGDQDFSNLNKSQGASLISKPIQKAVAVMSTGNVTGGLNTQYDNNLKFPPRALNHVRQFIGTQPMNEATYTFRQANKKEGAVGIQTEGQTKAQIDYNFTTKVLTPVTIAVFSVQTLQLIRDFDALGTYVSDQMVEDLLLFEDQKLLNGPGGANDIEGIALNAVAYSPTDTGYNTYFDYLIDAQAQLATANYAATGHMIHPLAWAKLLLRKANTGEYDYPVLVFNGNLTLAGIPIVATNALLNRFQFITGDWRRTSILEREGISVALSYEDADNFRKNLVTIRVEEAITQAIYYPKAFINGSFGALGS